MSPANHCVASVLLWRSGACVGAHPEYVFHLLRTEAAGSVDQSLGLSMRRRLTVAFVKVNSEPQNPAPLVRCYRRDCGWACPDP